MQPPSVAARLPQGSNWMRLEQSRSQCTVVPERNEGWHPVISDQRRWSTPVTVAVLVLLGSKQAKIFGTKTKGPDAAIWSSRGSAREKVEVFTRPEQHNNFPKLFHPSRTLLARAKENEWQLSTVNGDPTVTSKKFSEQSFDLPCTETLEPRATKLRSSRAPCLHTEIHLILLAR